MDVRLHHYPFDTVRCDDAFGSTFAMTTEAVDYAGRSADAHELLAGFALYMPLYAPLRAHPRFADVRDRLVR